jgi:dinuclear metal center YbgI/SA1388 family protein
MSCHVGDLVVWLEEMFPPALAEDWDMVGLQVGDREMRIESVMVALDPSHEALAAAIQVSPALLVTHHPVWLRPLPYIRRHEPVGKRVWEAICNNVGVYCAHTNLDRASGGPNDLLAERLGMTDLEDLENGIGRVGNLSGPWSPSALGDRIRAGFPEAQPRIAGYMPEQIHRIAVCGGSGAGMLQAARRKGAQLLVTGDGKYHDAREAEALGIGLVDIGHFASEQLIVPWLVELLRRESACRCWGVTIRAYDKERDPFRDPRNWGWEPS